jgi:serine protease
LLTPIPGAGIIAQDLVDSDFSMFTPEDLKWNDLNLPLTTGRVQIDSTGLLHHVTPSPDGTSFIYEVTDDAGATWTQRTVSLPQGYQIEDYDFRVHGALGLAALALHTHNTRTGTDQDMLYRMTFPEGMPTVDRFFYVGDGDAVIGSGVTAPGARFDFATTAILPDGAFALSFADLSHDNPAVAILTNEDAGPAPDPTTEPPPSGPDDTHFAQQWALGEINAPDAWALADGSGIRVAVISTGADLDHEDLTCPNKIEIVPGSDLVDNDDRPDDSGTMGTNMAGVIAACTNNGIGIAGVAPNATILPIRAEGPVPEAIDVAVRAGAHVIAFEPGYGLGSDPTNMVFPRFQDAVQAAVEQGAVVLAPSGGWNTPNCEEPASYPEIICVAPIDRNGIPTVLYNQAAKIEGPSVVAPGGLYTFFCNVTDDFSVITLEPPERVTSCNDDHVGYAEVLGGHVAMAHGAGVAALVYDRLGGERTAANSHLVTDAIVDTAQDLGAAGKDPVFGSGLVDAAAAVAAVTPADVPVDASNLAFTSGSATTAQYTDAANVEAALTDSTGAPVAGALVTFELSDADSSRSWSVVTDDAGLASATIDAADAPGPYRLTATYDGLPEVRTPAKDATGFVIEKEDTTVNLTLQGSGADRSLYATLVSSDDGTPLEGRAIVFFADGRELCVVPTDATGGAACTLPAKFKGGSHMYEAVFRGDAFYLRAEDREET